MFRRKIETPLKEYWERKLNINYQVEIEYYKKLCGLSYNSKLFSSDFVSYNNLEFITYSNWKHHIVKIIEKLNSEELEEYSRFLNQQYRNKETKLGSFSSLLIPFSICFISSGVINPVFDIIMEIIMNGNNSFLSCKYIISTVALLIEIAVILLVSSYILFKWFNNTNDKESVYKYFYYDDKEIDNKQKEKLYEKNKSEYDIL